MRCPFFDLMYKERLKGKEGCTLKLYCLLHDTFKIVSVTTGVKED